MYTQISNKFGNDYLFIANLNIPQIYTKCYIPLFSQKMKLITNVYLDSSLVVTLYLYFKIITAFKVYRIYVRIYKFNTWNLVWLKVPKDSFALVRIVVQRTFLCQ